MSNNSDMPESNKLLLLDAIGALVSSIGLAILIPAFHSYFNFPIDVLYILGVVAAIFSIYSFFSYLFSGEKWRKFLRIIAIANLSYCILTAALVVKLLDVISVLAIAYFLAEILLVVSLAIWELKVAYQK